MPVIDFPLMTATVQPFKVYSRRPRAYPAPVRFASGNVSDITFSNINISTRYYDPSWWGRAEP
ncbi:hypothetical protein GIB67_018150, partial [Kingdonia uniflora]